MEILQPFLRNPWENYFNMFPSSTFLHFSPLVFLFLWPSTNFYMLTALCIWQTLHCSAGLSPWSSTYRFQWNIHSPLPYHHVQTWKWLCLNDAFKRIIPGCVGNSMNKVLSWLSCRWLVHLGTLKVVRWFSLWGGLGMPKKLKQSRKAEHPSSIYNCNAVSTYRQNGVWWWVYVRVCMCPSEDEYVDKFHWPASYSGLDNL